MKNGRRVVVASIAASLALLCVSPAAQAGDETQNVTAPSVGKNNMSGTITWTGTKNFKYDLILSGSQNEAWNEAFYVQYQALHTDFIGDSNWARLTDDWRASVLPREELQAKGYPHETKAVSGYHNGPGLSTGYRGVRFRLCTSAGCGKSSPDYLRPNHVGK